MPLEYQKEINTEYRVCTVSVQCVRLKEEPVEHECDSSEACACVHTVKKEPVEQPEYSESTVDLSLYAGHVVKDEIVLGPELLQPPERALTQPKLILESSYPQESCDVETGRVDCPAVSKVKHDDGSGSILLKQVRLVNKENIFEKTSRSTDSWGRFTNSHPDVGLRACSVRLEPLPVYKEKQANSAITQDKNEIETKSKVCTESDVYSNGRMQEQFPQKQSLIPHISHSLKKNKNKSVECEICLKSFTSFKFLVRHLQIHIGTNTNECKICKRQFLHKAKLVRHMGNHKSNENYNQILQKDTPNTSEKWLYKCEICLKTFKCSFHLKKHTGKHERQAQLKCKYCNKQIAKLSRLIEHERIHTGEKPYKCNICLKRFARKRYAVTHSKKCKSSQRYDPTKRKVTRLYKCDICMHLFTRKQCLTNHKRLHTGEKPYQCVLCMKRFATSAGLYHHRKRKHESYTCDACWEQFKDKDKLRVHIHCLCESLCCAICGVRFEHRGLLRRHARAHIGPGPENAQTQKESVALDDPPMWKIEPGWRATGPAL